MTRKNIIVLVIILVIFGFGLWTILPLDSNRLGRDGLKLGLDLVGGVHLVYQADFADNMTASERDAALERTIITIENRIDKYGVVEPIIQRMGDDRILIQLPGFTDIDAAKQLVEQTGFLEFRQVEVNTSGDAVTLSTYLAQDNLYFVDAQEPGDRLFSLTEYTEDGEQEHRTIAILTKDNEGNIYFTNAAGEKIEKDTLTDYGTLPAWVPARGANGEQLTGGLLADAQPLQDTSGVVPAYVVGIEWTDEGTKIFDEVATELYNRANSGEIERALGIFLDNTMLSYPQINQATYGSSAQIEGSFTPQEVEELANLLKSGSLPIPLEKPPLYQETISATLGANFIDMSWKAGLIGIALVMIFMMAYYRAPGVVASLALVIYGVIVLSIFKLWPVTLSLAGLGGFIVSIGMAVDANVLIFERFKEEMRKGRTLGAAVEEGFNRAWSAILDSNVTTIIACIILIWLASSVIASSQVMGFAVTLLIGVIMSMFTAIVITRTLLRFFVSSGPGRNSRLYLSNWGTK